MLVCDLQHDRFHGGVGEAVARVLGLPVGQVDRGPVTHGRVDATEQGQVDVEGVGDPPGPQSDALRAGGLAGPAAQHEFPVRVVRRASPPVSTCTATG